MKKNLTIAVIGAGHLGSSILDRLKKNGYENLIATRRNSPGGDKAAAEKAGVIILATKEADFEDVAKEIREAREGKLLITVGPTWTLSQLGSVFGGKNARVITPVNASKDVICFCMDEKCTPEDELVIREIFGENLEKVAESEMPLATTYVLFRGILNSFFEPFAEIGIAEGMEEKRVRKILGRLLISAGEEIENGVSAEERLSNASGGLNEASFTMKLYKQIEPAQLLLKDLFEKVCNGFKK